MGQAMEKHLQQLRELFQKQDDDWKRHQEFLPKSSNLELHVLKAHLVIEEMIFGMVSKYCRNPAQLDSARLSFSQLCSIARALVVIPEDPDRWKAILLVNKLRNKFAHNLQPDAVDNIVDQICRLVKCHGRNETKSGDAKLLADFGYAFGKIVGMLSVYLPLNSYIASKLEVDPNDAELIKLVFQEQEQAKTKE